MTIEQTQTERLRLVQQLAAAEFDLYKARHQYMPMKDDRYSSELQRKLKMESDTAELQTEVDTLQRTLAVFDDWAKYLIAKG